MSQGEEPCRLERIHVDPTSAKDPRKRSLSPTHGDVFSFFVGQFFPRKWWTINIVFFWSGSVHHYHHCLPTSTRDVTLESWAPWISKTSINLARLASRISSARFLQDPVVLRIVIQRASQLEGLVNWGRGKADSHSFVFASLIKHSPKSFPSTKNHIRNW